MTVRLKLEENREGLVATISQRDDAGKVVGHPSVFLVGTKEEAKQRAKTLARSLGLKVYGVVDKTDTGVVDKTDTGVVDKTDTEEKPHPWIVPGAGDAI